MSQPTTLAKGDWLVHLMYGPGEIQEIETKSIAGEERKYYRVKAEDSIFWVPVDISTNERVRPLATPERITRALRVLNEAPDQMLPDHKQRRKRIHEDVLDGKLRSDVQLIRDLSARQRQKGINKSEQDSLERVKNRFLKEWALSMGIEINEANHRLNQLLLDNCNLVEQV
jgi:RNA polymerase-interacting CarD/CdnL/TRCF family regulator